MGVNTILPATILRPPLPCQCQHRSKTDRGETQSGAAPRATAPAPMPADQGGLSGQLDEQKGTKPSQNKRDKLRI